MFSSVASDTSHTKFSCRETCPRCHEGAELHRPCTVRSVSPSKEEQMASELMYDSCEFVGSSVMFFTLCMHHCKDEEGTS